jgi:hypothetical protein
LARYEREIDMPISLEDLDPCAFVDWLLASRPFWKEATWRIYRSSAAQLIQSLPSDSIKEALGWLYADLHFGRDEGGRGDPAATSRAARMDHDHFVAIKQQLRLTSRSEIARCLENWLDAGIHTGLRPAEWPVASLEVQPDDSCPRGKRIWLHVPMGQFEFGWFVHRTLDISDFSKPVLEAVQKTIHRSRAWARAGIFSVQQGQVSRVLHETSKQLFGQMQLHYNLHSLRAQFTENMRQIYKDAEVAALTGNLGVGKVPKHSTKRRAAWAEISEVPRPMQQQVKQMKRRLELFEERRAVWKVKSKA